MVKAKIFLAHRYNLQVAVCLQCRRLHSVAADTYSIKSVNYTGTGLPRNTTGVTVDYKKMGIFSQHFYIAEVKHKPVGLQVCRTLDVYYVFFRRARPNVSMDLLCV